MKQLKLLFTAIILLFSAVSCEETDPYSYLKIQGTWLLQAVNDYPVDTDTRTVAIFSEKDACTVALMYDNNGSRKWQVNDGLSWNFHGTVLEISGMDANNNVFVQNNTFLSVDDNTLVFTVNGVESQAGGSTGSYNCKFSRVLADSRNYSGTWECLHADGVTNPGIRIRLDGNHAMSVFSLENGTWQQKLSAEYFTYNGFIAINYTDSDSGLPACGTWDYDMAASGNSVTWLWTKKSGETQNTMLFQKVNE